MEERENTANEREDIFSKVIRAGKRTYFFDVRQNRSNDDYYLVITESIKRFNEDGTHYYHKHKIYLYKEDFGKFTDGLAESVKAVIGLRNKQNEDLGDDVSQKFTDIEFDDLMDEKEQTVSDDYNDKGEQV